MYVGINNENELVVHCINVSLPQRGGAVPSPLFERWTEMADIYPEWQPFSCAQSSGNIFSFSRPL